MKRKGCQNPQTAYTLYAPRATEDYRLVEGVQSFCLLLAKREEMRGGGGARSSRRDNMWRDASKIIHDRCGGNECT